MYDRLIEKRVLEALADTPVVLVTGPRRAGKTTLVRKLSSESRKYHTLDDQSALDFARADPVGFVRALDAVVIDEVQRVPELLLAIKVAVDSDARPGRFLLTGSANVLNLPKVADSLAGRIEVIEMLPLSQAEIQESPQVFVERLFERSLIAGDSPVVGDALIKLVLLGGGYPEAIQRKNETERLACARSYIASMMSKDLAQIGYVEKASLLLDFIQLLAHGSGQLVNYSKIGAAIGINYKTGQCYCVLLEQLYLISTLRPWHASALKRVTKTPKIHFFDPLLQAAVRDLRFHQLQADRTRFGPLLENFVCAEVLKLLAAADSHCRVYHFRDQNMHEVDVVLERCDRRVAGIGGEVFRHGSCSGFQGSSLFGRGRRREICLRHRHLRWHQGRSICREFSRRSSPVSVG